MSQATSRTSRSHQTDSAEHGAEPGRSFLRSYWAEISAVVLFGLGVFLLVEQMQIKMIIWHWLVASYQATVAFVRGLLHAVYNWFAPIEVSGLCWCRSDSCLSGHYGVCIPRKGDWQVLALDGRFQLLQVGM